MFANTLVSVILLLASVNSAVAAPIFGRQVDFASGERPRSVVEERHWIAQPADRSSWFDGEEHANAELRWASAGQQAPGRSV